MLGGATASAACGGQARALARAVVRELVWGLRAVSVEVRRWRVCAEGIPDATIRREAVNALENKRLNADGAALFWTVTRRRCPGLLRLLVAYEVMADFLDSMVELGAGAGAGAVNGRQLHLAMVEAVDVDRPISQYLRHHPWQEDGGYLRALVLACRTGCLTLPSYAKVRPALVRAATLAQVQGLTHELDRLLREAILRRWAERELKGDCELDWYEAAGAASAWLTVLALLALAAEPGPTPRQSTEVYLAYFPWFTLSATLLDSYGDIVEDRVEKKISYIAYYGSLQRAVERMDEVLANATVAICLLENGAGHAVIFGAMVAMYLSKDSVIDPELGQISRSLMRSAGPLASLLGPVLKGWRAVNSLKDA
jgi:tetraprenyl-beta-curcumene synthase